MVAESFLSRSCVLSPYSKQAQGVIGVHPYTTKRTRQRWVIKSWREKKKLPEIYSTLSFSTHLTGAYRWCTSSDARTTYLLTHGYLSWIYCIQTRKTYFIYKKTVKGWQRPLRSARRIRPRSHRLADTAHGTRWWGVDKDSGATTLVQYHSGDSTWLRLLASVHKERSEYTLC